MSGTSPILVWFRRDLRLSDHPALTAACGGTRPVIPVFILDPLAEKLQAAPKWRLGLGVRQLAQSLKRRGSHLVLRRGDALSELQSLVRDTGAGAVYWTRLYDPDSVQRDTAVKHALKEQDIDARSFGGHLLFEPWTVQTKTGGFYKVFSPMWKAVKNRNVDLPLPEPGNLTTPGEWPESDDLETWGIAGEMNRGADVVAPYVRLGETSALDRLEHFMASGVSMYQENRDFPGVDGTSCLSENLSLGEISPHRCWHAALWARQEGKNGAETFLKELVWREFAYHLMHHTPHILRDNWKKDWDTFPWHVDATSPDVMAWKQGRTGIEFVDAAMRELYVTGRMHNRSRMIVASYLTKHLMHHWKIGLDWFEHTLIDWDPASNAMGWQWAAGSGPDAAPYFRVFNPVTQLDRFDRDRRYVRRWIAEGQSHPPKSALSFFDAVPRSWKLSPSDPYPSPIVTAQEGRLAALQAYENRGF